MSTLFDKNLNVIMAVRPDLGVILTECEEDEIIAGTENIEGREVLYAAHDNSVIQLDSMYDSSSMTEQYVQTLNIIPGSRIYMFGLGNGMYAKALLDVMDGAGRLFIYEPSLKLMKVCLEYFDMTRVLSDERVTLFTPWHELAGVELFKSLGHSLDYSDIPLVRRGVYPNYDLLFEEQYIYFEDRVNEILDSMESNRVVYERFGEYFAVNGLYNVPFVKESRDTYDLGRRIPKGYPGIIVSAGPSLNKNIELLKEIDKRAFIVACDTAVKPLLAHGIVPDIFVSVDANKSPKHYDDDRIKRIPIVGDFSTCRGALDGHQGPYFFARSDNPHMLAFFEENNIDIPKLGTGGSVANTCFSFLEKLGVTRIIMVGQDLAYTDNKSHADGATRATWGLDLDKNSVMVEDQQGGMIKSSGEFVHYRNWFERSIEVCKDIDVINATEGGARIHGAREMSLRQAIDEYCNEAFDMEKAIYDSKYVLSDEQKAAFEAYMGNVSISIENMRMQLKKGIRIYDDMTGMVYERKYQNNQFKKLFEKTKDITVFVEGESALYYAECMVQKEMTELLKTGTQTKEDEREELLDAIAAGRARFELLLTGCEKILEIEKKEAVVHD